ncbi:GNAT family N-acetyltransferase [Conexibacter sp. SYSU D00693]|uniref:GNAT family N-acetyltransferase n=1 Tax=Conexibacter sp. SYSU D00693 TaxID=2812560 RepID=UPI00196AEDBE|nr:GNAT family N-acetyltransferase [Conexibacter sp. SYSU D00693]
MDLRLRDIRPDDKPALQRLHARLSPETRYRRFHGVKGDLTRGDLRYLTEVDGRRHIALVAEDEAGELHGVARAVGDQGGVEAELAIVVADDVQADGLGTALMRSLLERCDREGLRRITFEVQADNHRALRFFQGHGARQARTVGSVCTLVLEREALRADLG